MGFKYVNVGYTRLLTSTAVWQIGPGFDGAQYGYAFAQTDEAACFGIPATGEIWIRLRFYHGDAGPLYSTCYCGDATTAFSGIKFTHLDTYTDNYAKIYADGELVHTADDYNLGLNTSHLYWLHMRAGVSDGLIEYKLLNDDGTVASSYTYNGPLNAGADFSNVYTSGSTSGQFWSNIVISDAAVGLTENAAPDITLRADTLRDVSISGGFIQLRGDTKRRIGYSFYMLGDTFRKIANEVTINASTSRQLPILYGDTRRDLLRHVTLHGDTMRNLQVILSADTRRRIANQIIVNGDTKRRIPHNIQTDFSGPPYPTDGITDITLSLSAATLTDNFSYGTTIPCNVKDELSGYVLDFPYHFIVESTTHKDLTMTAKCTYDTDEILYTPYRFAKQTESVNARVYAAMVAGAMGKGLIYQGRTFIPKTNFSGQEITYKDIIAGVFGWTTRCPRIQFNVFMRGDNLYVVERGYETGTVNLDTLGYFERPTISRELVRTIWSRGKGVEEGEIHTFVAPPPRIISDDKTPEPGYQTSYEDSPSGNSDSRPTETNIYHEDGSHTTVIYTYASTGNDFYLYKEDERTWDADGNLVSMRITTHQPLQNGWRNDTVVQTDEDGNTIGSGSSMSRGRPGDAANTTYDDMVTLAHGGRWEDGGQVPGGTSLVNTDFPCDETTAHAFAAEVVWMDRKIHETVNIDLVPPIVNSVPVYQHIIDFTDKVVYGGNEYYLDANTANFTPTGHRQSLQLVRWY